MSKKVNKGTYWITNVGEIFEVKKVFGGNVGGYAYSRTTGRRDDCLQVFPIKDLLEVANPCNVVKTEYIDKKGNLMYKTVEFLEVKGGQQ